MFDKFASHLMGTTSPALGAFTIVPSDSTDLNAAVRAVTIGTQGGTVAYVGRDGVSYSTDVLPLGTYPLFAHRILATGTTATGLTGWQ